MKKLLLLLFVMIAPISYAGAQVQGEELDLQVAYDNTPGTNNPKPKTPVTIPTIIQNDYTLTFITACDNCTLRLINEDNEVEYSTTIHPFWYSYYGVTIVSLWRIQNRNNTR